MSPILDSIGSVKGYGWGGFLSLSSYESIATATGTGSSGTITFSSIPSTYKSLQIRIMAHTSSGTFPAINMQFNSDTGTNYVIHRLFGNGTSVTANATTASSNISVCAAFGDGSNTTTYGVSITDIIDYASTSKNKTVRSLTGKDDNSGTTNSTLYFYSGLWLSTNAITDISLTATSGNFNTSSVFALYGIKG